MVRAVMPIVEAVASSEGRYPSDVLAELGYGAPHLMWDLYRNVFLHGDEFVTAAVGDKVVGTGIALTPVSEDDAARTRARDGLTFDAAYTYRRLLEYLDARIDETADQASVEVVKEIRYDPDCANDVVMQKVAQVLSLHKAATQAIGEPEE